MTYTVVTTAAQGSDEWLDARRNGIGGSDVAAVLGANPYRSPLDVWLSKTRDEDTFTGNERTVELRGILTDLIAELRDTHRPFDSADDCCPDCAGICESCADEAPCRSARAADRAEARLKGLDDE